MYTIQDQIDNLVTTLARHIRLVYQDAIGGRLLPGILCLEHQVLIALNPQQTLKVVLLAFTDEISTPPVQVEVEIDHIYLIAPIPERDARTRMIANALVKQFLGELDGRSLRGALETRPYNPFYKRVIL